MKRKKILDEMQDQKRLQIESRGLWVAFYGLVLMALVQSALIGDPQLRLRANAGEIVLLIALAVYLLPCYIRNGIWSTTLKPTFKTNLIISCAAGFAAGLFWGILSYIRYGKLTGSFATAAFVFFGTVVPCMLLLTLFSWMYKHRLQKLENAPEDGADKPQT